MELVTGLYTGMYTGLYTGMYPVVYPETINLYYIFLSSFVTSAFACFIQDIYCDYPYVQGNRYNTKEILNVYYKSLPLVLLNMFISVPVSLLVSQYFFGFLSPFNYYQIYHIPVFFILIDPTFFTFHRLFHTVKFLDLYKYHKVHHQIPRPVGITSLYLHPVDLIFGNILPLFLPVFIIRSSMPLLYFWTAFTVFETTYISHSGIKNRAENHDMHHKLTIFNYGSGLYFMDRIFNTYRY
jgi:sterol desaturase/sphingolipid hydroxylase (fatty acid hydroxylase superfamily)